MATIPTGTFGPIERLLALFAAHPDVDSLAFYGSDQSGVEARALDRKGRSLPLDLRPALGDSFWRQLELRAGAGAPVVITRVNAHAQAFDLLGDAEAARYESDQLMQAASSAVRKRRVKAKKHCWL